MPEQPAHESVELLLEELAEEDALRRQHARHHLVFLGASAVPALCDALEHENLDVRWEAAKALSSTADRRAARALAEALADPHDGVGWLAAVTLPRLGRHGLEATLRSVVRHAESYGALLLAHHVLHEFAREEGLRDFLAATLAALESPDRELRAPVAAERALLDLGRPPPV